MGSVADLTRFRTADPAPQIATAPGNPVVDWPEARVLAFDQTLGSTGWVDLRVEGGALSVFMAQTLRPPTFQSKGHELNLDRSVAMQGLITETILALHAEAEIDLVVHETPPAANRVQRPESSLLAAHCVRYACAQAGLPVVMVGAQVARKVLTGNARTDKAETHAALRAQYGGIEGYEHVTNEHERDALALVLAHLREEHQ